MSTRQLYTRLPQLPQQVEDTNIVRPPKSRHLFQLRLVDDDAPAMRRSTCERHPQDFLLPLIAKPLKFGRILTDPLSRSENDDAIRYHGNQLYAITQNPQECVIIPQAPPSGLSLGLCCNTLSRRGITTYPPVFYHAESYLDIFVLIH